MGACAMNGNSYAASIRRPDALPTSPVEYNVAPFFAAPSAYFLARVLLPWRWACSSKASFLAGIASLLLASSALALTPNFIQGNNAVPPSPQSKVTLSFSAAQSAGDLNVVVVGWGDASSQVSSVSDSKGNLYRLAVGPTALTGSASLTQSIYYAKNILAASAGANVVTLTFNAAVASPDIRILEYSGLDPLQPLDVSSAATGNSASSSSGAALTTSPMDLLVGANVVWTSTSAPGSGFIQRMITSPDGDIAQDRIVSAAGTYEATLVAGR